MSRLPTSFALSLWLGFFAVTGASEVAGVAGIASLLGQALETPAASGVRSAFVAGLCFVAAAVMALALVAVNASEPARIARGEVVAFGGVGIASSMVLAALLFGEPFAHVFDRIDLAFWSLGLTLAALAFDAAVRNPTEGEEDEDDLAYRKMLLGLEAPRAAERRIPETEELETAGGER